MSRTLQYCVRIALPAGIALLLTAACSKDPTDLAADSAVGASNLDPNLNVCELTKASELEAIIGGALPKSTSFMNLKDPGCIWLDAENMDTIQIIVMHDNFEFDNVKTTKGFSPVSGAGDAAFIGPSSVVYIRAAGHDYFAQSMNPVKDGQVSPEVRAAAVGASEEDQLKYEASLRIARLIVSKF